MGFAEGLMICFIGGWLNSYLYSYHLRKKNKAWIFWFAILWIGAVLTVDFLIYINIINAYWFEAALPWVNIPNDIPPEEVGRYWMLTPGLMFGIPFQLPVKNYSGLVWDIFALIFFISYIWWFTIGQNLGRFMFGRLEYERGAWYLLRSTKMIKRSKEKLEKKQQKNS
ncbi:MAG: hypothetical protein ACTSR8_13515 [Promethearchaeota archaeon]